MSEHHEMGPSAQHRRRKCPGSRNMELGMPDKTSSDAAEGTMLHTACEAKLLYGDMPPGLTDEQQSVVHVAIEFAKHHLECMAPLAERRVVSLHADGSPLFFGTADVIGVTLNANDESWGIVADYKFGRDPVDSPADNDQMAALALACHDTFGLAAVKALIIQPRAPWGEERCREYTFTDWGALRRHFMNVDAACREPDAPLVPGWSQCHYCKAFEVCPAAKNVREAPILQVMNKSLPAVCDLPDDVLANFYRRWKFAEKYANEVKQELKGRAESNGGTCGGWELGKGAEERKVEDIIGAWERIGGVAPITSQEFMACASLSLPKLEAMVKTLLDVSSKQKTSMAKVKELVAECLGDLITYTRKDGSLKDKGVLAP